jgi:hypothetical protein
MAIHMVWKCLRSPVIRMLGCEPSINVFANLGIVAQVSDDVLESGSCCNPIVEEKRKAPCRGCQTLEKHTYSYFIIPVAATVVS